MTVLTQAAPKISGSYERRCSSSKGKTPVSAADVVVIKLSVGSNEEAAAVKAITCPAFINPILVVNPMARSHATATISLFGAVIGWI